MLLLWAVNNPPEAAALLTCAIAFVLMMSSYRTAQKGHNALTASQARSFLLRPWLAFRRRLNAWAFLFKGRQMMHDAYKQVNRQTPRQGICAEPI